MYLVAPRSYYRSDLADFRNCNYKNGLCTTKDAKHLRWKIDTNVENEYIEVGTYNSIKINNTLAIEELGMAFKVQIPLPITNTWIDREFRLTKVAARKVLRRPKLKGEGNTIEALRDEIQSKFAFLIEMIKSPKSKMTYICDVLNDITRIERLWATINPTKYIRQKTGNTALVAEHAGDYIITWPCYKIDTYEWIDCD